MANKLVPSVYLKLESYQLESTFTFTFTFLGANERSFTARRLIAHALIGENSRAANFWNASQLLFGTIYVSLAFELVLLRLLAFESVQKFLKRNSCVFT